MTEKLRNLQKLKALCDLIKSDRQARLSGARAAEQEIAREISKLKADRTREARDADRSLDALRLEAWLAWSSVKLTKEQARRARARADLEMKLDAFRRAFGRAAALDELVEKERAVARQRRNRA